MRSQKLFAAALLALFMTLAAANVFAQSDRGSITGTVTDPSGAVVPNAKVTATSLDTGEARETTTSGEGSYTLPELKAGRYKITVEAQGFKTATVDEYKVAVQVTHSLDLKLEVGAVNDVVTVTGESAAAIQTDTPTRQTNVTERQGKAGKGAAARSRLGVFGPHASLLHLPRQHRDRRDRQRHERFKLPRRRRAGTRHRDSD